MITIGASVGGGVAVGNRVSVGVGVSVGDAVLVGDAAPVGAVALIAMGGLVGGGDGVASMPLHAADISSITTIQHRWPGSLIFNSFLLHLVGAKPPLLWMLHP